MGRGIVEYELFRSERYGLEERTADPAEYADGEMWIRTDLAPETDQLATLRFDKNGTLLDVPIFDTAASTDAGISKAFRVSVGGVAGFIPLYDGGSFDALKFQHNSAVWELHDSLSVIPDSELFEHNDLTGNYGGDTASYSIQTGTVNEGSYALFGDGGGAAASIVRSTEDPWDRYGIRVTWDQYNPSSVSGNGGVQVATSVTGHSSLDGYQFYSDSKNNNRNLRRVDDGSTTKLDSDLSTAVTGDTWLSAQVDFLSDGTIEFSIDGVTLSAVDETYQSVLLGFTSFRDVYIDNVQFAEV